MLLGQFDSIEYIKCATGDPLNGHNFFAQYLIHLQNPWDVVSEGRQLLHKCYNTDPLAYTRIYKGWIFFYLGLASFRLQDYEIALFFIDNAISCDVQAKFDPINNPSHAMRFAQLDSTLPEHKDFIIDAESRIADVIRIYNSRSISHALSVSDLRNKFLLPSVDKNRPKWQTLSTTFISLCLEWNYRDELFAICPDSSAKEPYFLHLFKGCLLFESLLKNNLKYPPKNEISNLEDELRRLRIQLDHDNEKLKISGKTLNQVVNKIDAETDKSLPTAMQYTGWLRNTLGHNLGWDVSLSKNQYQKLFYMVTSSCLHVISCLYE